MALQSPTSPPTRDEGKAAPRLVPEQGQHRLGKHEVGARQVVDLGIKVGLGLLGQGACRKGCVCVGGGGSQAVWGYSYYPRKRGCKGLPGGQGRPVCLQAMPAGSWHPCVGLAPDTPAWGWGRPHRRLPHTPAAQ
jgi:hypothetical protein